LPEAASLRGHPPVYAGSITASERQLRITLPPEPRLVNRRSWFVRSRSDPWL